MVQEIQNNPNLGQTVSQYSGELASDTLKATVAFNGRVKQKIEAAPQMLRLLFFGIALLVVGLLGLAFQQAQDPGFLANLPNSMMANFVQPMEEQDYIEQYRQGVQALQAQENEQAIGYFEAIREQSHPLRPMVWINLSKAYAAVSREGDAQRTLLRLSANYSSSVLSHYANYLLAQSYLRSGQPDRARDRFAGVLKAIPESQLALGCHYYLGELAQAAKTPSVVAEHWLAYIRKSQDGAFSFQAAQGVVTLAAAETPADHTALGKIFLANDTPDQAIIELNKGPFEQGWLPLAKAYELQSDDARAKDTILRGLKVAQTQAEAEEGVKLLMKITPSPAKKATLLALAKQPLPYAGDLVLWQLLPLLSDVEKAPWMSMLVSKYPQSDWAPTTSWNQAWAIYQKGQKQAFITAATQHLEKYGYSRSAPAALFWRAKAQKELGQTVQAEADLQALVTGYPRQYYAFRAQQILNHTSSPWRIPQEQRALPETPSLEGLDTLGLTTDTTLNLALPHLVGVRDSANIETLTNLFGQPKKAKLAKAVAATAAEQPQLAIKLLSEYAHDLQRANQGKPDPGAHLGTWPRGVYELWYPIENAEQVAEIAAREHLNPFLVLALTRQESAFNKLAISSSKAMGLMQLLPTTAAEVAKQIGISGYSTPQLFNPETNIRLGTRYLKGLHDRFNGNSIEAIGAYNGGPGAMSRWKSQIKTADPDLFIEKIPYEQTRDYIKSVYAHYWNYCLTYNACSVD